MACATVTSRRRARKPASASVEAAAFSRNQPISKSHTPPRTFPPSAVKTPIPMSTAETSRPPMDATLVAR